MCGITGILAFNMVGKFNRINISAATLSMEKRGPDFQDIYLDDRVGLGHRRLSVIDTTPQAHQPMWDDARRYAIIFNGEIFNYRALRKEMMAQGVAFHSQSDTEVLLQLYIRDRENCLPKLNGFFAFCVYDKEEQSLFIARDRLGVKPLLYLHDEDKFIFGSEMKTMLCYGIDKTFDYTSLFTYLQLNYIPAPDTIFQHVKKLLPGHYLTVHARQPAESRMLIRQYYEVPRHTPAPEVPAYQDASREFSALLESAVQERLVADVPLGAFLSGGIDSSVITGLACRHKPDLHTFSIGFADEKFFDETSYARLVARHFGTAHTVFSLKNSDLYEHVHNILDYIDEPFADSSAINVYILSKHTRKYATVALSGDGADELLGGYNKHAAFYRTLFPGWREYLVARLGPIWRALPQSRNNAFGNLTRQLTRFSEGMKLDARQRYWRWAGYADEASALAMLVPSAQAKILSDEVNFRKSRILDNIPPGYTMNDILRTDMKLVLPNDMLTKADLMSMANGLEIRSPFLDYRLVNFVSGLPDHYKINGRMRKRILQDSFRQMLPPALYDRPKKGFEVPLLKWFRHEMKGHITADLLDGDFIRQQGIFNPEALRGLTTRLFSSSPGDVHARIWALVVFQRWFRKYGG